MLDIEIVLAEKSLSEFIKLAWPVLEPSTTYVHGWHIDAICEHLEAVTSGQLRRLIINVPPRYMKSLIVSVMWPCWEWGPQNLPHLRYLFSSYSSELVTKHSTDRRTLLRSSMYTEAWGRRFAFSEDNVRKTEFDNTKRGVMSTTSTGSTATGKGGNRVVIDDPLNPKQALSDVERENANTYFDQTLYTRLNDKAKDAIVLIMQRLHENDLTGHLLKEKKDEGWYHLNFEAEAEDRRTIIFPMSGKKVRREVGEILWPAREPKEILEKTKLALGSYAYAGQYQQRPAPLEGGVIQRRWWRRFIREQQPLSFHSIIISSDPKFKDYETSSRVATHVWGAVGPNVYLLDRICRHTGLVGNIQDILTLRARWSVNGDQVSAILVEDKANGPAIIEVLKKSIAGVIAVEPSGSKEARAIAQSPKIEAGNVWVVAEPWGDEVIDAWAFVPTGDNWDDVDAASQALRYLSKFDGIDIAGIAAINAVANSLVSVESYAQSVVGELESVNESL